MKPIAVFQHTVVGAPGAVVPILQALGREVRLVRIVAGEPVPTDPSAFSGLVFMGGYMGVHDDYPWIAQELALIRAADAQAIPVAGHCLGSQLVALALGGSVANHVQPEIGWQPLQTTDTSVARDWWGPWAGQTLETFQWHGDTFTPPPAALQIARSSQCEHQAFDDIHRIIRNRHHDQSIFQDTDQDRTNQSTDSIRLACSANRIANEGRCDCRHQEGIPSAHLRCSHPSRQADAADSGKHC